MALMVHETEHAEDMEDACRAVQRAGGKVLKTQPDYDMEQGAILVELPEGVTREEFRKRCENEDMCI